MLLLKLGGHDLDNPQYLRSLATAVAALPETPVIVHGGGPAIAALQERLGLERRRVQGLRVTDADSLDAVVMVMAGQINKRLVAALVQGGVTAVGISGVDGGLLLVEKMPHPDVDLGFVGRVVTVRPGPLNALLAAGLTPVVSPVSADATGQLYNVNADDAAAALARALGVRELVYLSNVPGVLDGDGRRFDRLNAAQADRLIAAGTIRDGMIPKVRAAFAALGPTVPAVRIADLAGLAGGGTTFYAQEENA